MSLDAEGPIPPENTKNFNPSSHQQQNDSLWQAVESLEEMIAVVDRDYRYVLVNRAYLRYRGMTRQQLVGQLLPEVMDGGMFESIIKEKLDECFSGKTVNYELRYKYPNLGERDLSLTYLPIEGRDGIESVACVLKDVTEERRAADKLRQSQENIRLFIEHAPAALAMFDCEMRYLQASRRWRTDYGLVGRDLSGLLHYEIFPEIPAHWKEAHRRGLAGEVVSEKSDRFERRDGSVQWLHWKIHPWYDAAGSIGGIVIFTEDITDCKLAEDALRKSGAELREAQRLGHIGNWYRDLKTGTLTWSEQIHCMLGSDPKEKLLTFAQAERFFAPESLQRLVQANEKLLSTGGNDELEVEFDRQDGTGGWVVLYREAVRDDTGDIVGIRGVALDITARRNSERALRESEESMQLAQEVAGIGTFDRNLLTGEVLWNPEMYTIHGLPQGTPPLMQEQLIELIHADDRERFSRTFTLENDEDAGEFRVVCPDGTVRWTSRRWRVFPNNSGIPARRVGIVYDISDHKHVEEDLRQEKAKLTEEKNYLQQQVRAELGFQDIIGNSEGLKSVMELAAKVAGCDATVLLLGETGTGKELIARAIHRLSSRSENAFIKMNCAAIPSGLLESELFGAEKGAYTGSVGRKIGRLELADRGTLLLDEIGEISLALQPKLLRVLQDQEFERLGGNQTLRINFRLIAATNRNLAEEVERNQFRSDLFYRLNVFPIRIPPLRERRQDIPMLAEHFVKKCAARLNRRITSIPKPTMDALVEWDWPGNIRELENVIERSVILTSGTVLAVPLAELRVATVARNEAETLEAAERRHILEALRLSEGRISGQNGAAERLGLKRTTLQSKLKQMQVNPRILPPS